MTLADTIRTHNDGVFHNTDHFAVCAQFVTPAGQRRSHDIIFDETEEQQTIRRAEVWIKSAVELPFGTTFRQHGRTWRCFLDEPEEYDWVRWFCHEQLPDMVLILDKTWTKSVRGVDVWSHPDAPPAMRAKIHRSDGEVSESTRRRAMVSDFRIFFEDRVRPTTDQIIVGQDGRSYVVRAYEQTEDNRLLTYAICNAADG